MLSQVRGALKGIVAWIVIILLIMAFALVGLPAVQDLTNNSAVSVGSENYSAQYVQTQFNRLLERRRRESGEQFTQQDALAAGMQDQIVTSIVTTGAVKQLGESMRLVVPRELVRDYLQNNESFQNRATGKFDETVLQSILVQNNISASEFEKRIAEDLMREQLVTALTAGGPAPTPLSEAVLLRDTERRRISYLIVTNEMSGIPAEPAPDDLQAYYQQNPSAFTAPEYRSFDLLVLRAEDFRDNLTVSEEELKRLYDINKPRLYDVPETRTIYQITYDTLPEAQAAAAGLRQGKPFENIATDRGLTLESVTFSDIKKNAILDPAVAQAAFEEGQTDGTIIDPVKSLFGWTLIQIVNVNAPETKTFEEVRGELETDYLANDTRRAMLEAIDLIEEERDTGATLETAAQAAGLSVQSVGPIDRFSLSPEGAVIENLSAEAIEEAFNLEEGDESEALSLPDTDGYYLISLKEITDPALKPFDDVRDTVEQAWRDEERTNRITNTAKSVSDEIKTGATLAEAASPFDRTPIELLIDRRFENEAISSSLNQSIFSSTLNDVVSGPVALGEAQVVVNIQEIGFGRNSIPPAQAEMFKQYIGYQLDQELLEAFVTQTRDDYGVTINNAQLDSIFGGAQ